MEFGSSSTFGADISVFVLNVEDANEILSILQQVNCAHKLINLNLIIVNNIFIILTVFTYASLIFIALLM